MTEANIPAVDLRSLRELYEQGMLSKAEFVHRCSELHRHLFRYQKALKDSEVDSIQITTRGVRLHLADPGVCFEFVSLDRRAPPLEALNFGAYEASVRKVLFESIRLCSEQSGVILDVGANIGWYSVLLGKLFPKETVHAFEPIPILFEQLQRNLALNQISNVHPSNFGLSSASGSVLFHFDPACTVATSALYEQERASNGSGEEITGQLRTLDAVRDELKIRVKLIKCDIEGAELLFLRGARRTFEEDTPVLLTEMLRKWSARFGYTPNEMINFLGNLGYVCHAINEDGLRKIVEVDDSTIETNFLFLHAARHADMHRALSLP